MLFALLEKQKPFMQDLTAYLLIYVLHMFKSSEHCNIHKRKHLAQHIMYSRNRHIKEKVFGMLP